MNDCLDILKLLTKQKRENICPFDIIYFIWKIQTEWNRKKTWSYRFFKFFTERH